MANSLTKLGRSKWWAFIVVIIVAIIIFLLLKGSSESNPYKHVKQMRFASDDAYQTLTPANPKAYHLIRASYINTGSETSPGIFLGGAPLPMTLMGSWGPGDLYVWPQYIKQGDKAPSIARAKNILGLPNGIAMIHWDTNNLEASLANKYTVEMITGWGSYPKKVLANDYGWINGTIMNLLGKFQAPFIHIYYRKELGKNSKGVPQSTLYFWELLLDDNTFNKAPILYAQLKAQIDEYFAVTDGKTFPKYTGKKVPEPLASVINSVYFMKLPSNQQIPTVAPQYWHANTAYPENNVK